MVARQMINSRLVFCALLCVGVTFVACGKKEKEKKAEKAAAIEAVTGEKPGWPEELGDLKVGQTPEEWKAAGFKQHGSKKSEKFKKVEYNWVDNNDTGKIDGVRIDLKLDGGAEDVKAKWGDGVEVNDMGGQKNYYWFNPEENLRAKLEQSFREGYYQIEIRNYMSLNSLIGAEAGPLAFEKDKPVIGLTKEELKPAYPDWYRKDGTMISLELPPIETNSYWSRAHLEFDGAGKVTGYDISIDGTSEATKKNALELLTKKYGEAKTGKIFNADVTYFNAADAGLRVTVKEGTGEFGVRLEVEALLPLATLIKSKGLFSFEGDKTWIGNLDEAEYNKVKDTNFDFVKFPKTDASSGDTDVYVKFAGGKAVYYNFRISSDLDPTNHTKVVDKFKELYGTPVETKDYSDRPIYTWEGTPKLVVKQSYSDNEWDVEVGTQP